MHKISVFILSLIILAQSINFEFENYWNLPLLMEHLTDHIQNGDDVDSFISMHYGTYANDHDKEHKEHENLPFKHDHLSTNLHLDYFFYEKTNLTAFEDNGFGLEYFSYTEISFDPFINKFFQPPRK